MIRINLLGAKTREARRVAVPAAQRPAAIGLMLLVLTALGITGWWWQIQRERAAIDAQITTSEMELGRLKKVALLVERAATRKRDLTERLGLIDRLHRTQHDPVALLESVSRAVPDGLWLLELRQQGDAVQVEGRAMSVTAVTDFVDRLQTSGRFQRPVEILTTGLDTLFDVSVVRFAIKGKAVTTAATPVVAVPAVPKEGGDSWR